MGHLKRLEKTTPTSICDVHFSNIGIEENFLKGGMQKSHHINTERLNTFPLLSGTKRTKFVLTTYIQYCSEVPSNKIE